MFPLYVKNFNELLSGGTLIFLITFSIANGIFLFFASLKFLLALQQSGYHGKRYFKWLKSPETPYLSRLMLLCLLGFLFFCVLNMSFVNVIGETASSYVGICSYVLFTALYINSESSVNAKVPLRKTQRLVRLAVMYIILLSLCTFGVLVLLNFLAFCIGDETVSVLRYALICGLPMLIPYILFIAYFINEPFEEILKAYYVKKATVKLKNADVLKIGITGSFGKTTVKEILSTILSQKYRVLATQKSYNTPLGIAISTKKLDSTHDIFIAEMGARNKGDIKELAKIVKPKFGVLVGINNQHLESFGSIENTKNTKYELFENLSENGVGFFSSDNEGAVELAERFSGEKYCAGIAGNGLVTASDIEIDSKGTSFTLNIKGEKPIRCNTVLLGHHSVSNICLGAAVAYEIGMTPVEIFEGINRIKAVGHRLELVPNNKNIVIIDDSYNSNEDGIKAAMEILDTFSGRKIVVTPGMVELGKMENVLNLEFGKLLAKHVNMVFVIGKHNAEMLINGLKEGGFPVNNIKFAKTLNKGNAMLNEILKEGDVVLFENDLPDNYS